MKKINEDAITIKKLFQKGLTQKRIASLLGLKKQKVNYWANHEIKTVQSRRKKFLIHLSIKYVAWPKIELLN